MIDFVQGNALQIPLMSGSVQMVVTSPPYWGLRDYGTALWIGGDAGCDHNAEHPDGGLRSDRALPLGRGGIYRDTCCKCGAIRKDAQLGLERTPEEYVANLVAVFHEIWRVLRDDGTVWLNLGDSYWGGKGLSGYELPHEAEERHARGQTLQTAHNVPGYTAMRPSDGRHPVIKSKDLVGIPWRVAFALQADGWYLRSDIIWHKPNPMPESVTDRPTKAHEYLFLLAKSEKYYYDAEAVKEGYARMWDETNMSENNGWATGEKTGKVLGRKEMPNSGLMNSLPASGRNRRTVWTIATQPFKEAHFATFPVKLVEPCILAGTSERGACPKCGKAWARVVNKTPPGKHESEYQTIESGRGNNGDKSKHAEQSVSTTIGWKPICSCDAGEPVPCLVLDPFSGSGTVALVARTHNRAFVGLELKPDYISMALRRTAVIQPKLDMT